MHLTLLLTVLGTCLVIMPAPPANAQKPMSANQFRKSLLKELNKLSKDEKISCTEEFKLKRSAKNRINRGQKIQGKDIKNLSPDEMVFLGENIQVYTNPKTAKKLRKQSARFKKTQKSTSTKKVKEQETKNTNKGGGLTDAFGKLTGGGTGTGLGGNGGNVLGGGGEGSLVEGANALTGGESEIDEGLLGLFKKGGADVGSQNSLKELFASFLGNGGNVDELEGALTDDNLDELGLDTEDPFGEDFDPDNFNDDDFFADDGDEEDPFGDDTWD